MAQVASVYSIDRHLRSPEDIIKGSSDSPAPKPQAKRVWVSLEHSAEKVVGDMFAEADRRDPGQRREWGILVDGQGHQLDLIHVIEYLWKASRSFHPEGSLGGEGWVSR